jgi:hypothetical protein
MPVLRTFFTMVETLPEAPSKTDFGDVDFLVAGPRPDANVDAISKALKAVMHTNTCFPASFAVPLGVDGAYAQIDVCTCAPELLQWQMWLGGYGDLAIILGSLHRSLGLTISHSGLYVRVEEMEKSSRKGSLLYLDSNPAKVMEFLGLDIERYNQGFETTQEIFEWCSAGRFYARPQVREDFTDHDRKKAKTRTMFARFYSEWVVSQPEERPSESPWTRTAVLREALAFFGVREAYESKTAAWNRLVLEQQTIQAIKDGIPATGERKARIMRGLKRWTAFQDGAPVLRELSDGRETIDATPEWVAEVFDGSRLDEFLGWVKDQSDEISRRQKSWSVIRAEARAELERAREMCGS